MKRDVIRSGDIKDPTRKGHAKDLNWKHRRAHEPQYRAKTVSPEGFADYSAGVAAFRQLYADCEQRWDCFHAGAAQLAKDPARRRAFVGP